MSAWDHRLAPPATRENLKDPAWRKRVGFDNTEPAPEGLDIVTLLSTDPPQMSPYPMAPKLPPGGPKRP